MTNHITFYQFCSALRRKGALALCLAACMLGLGLSASAQKPAFITFDAGAGYTFPYGINPAGAIAGNYALNNVWYGFLRAPDGTITTFEAPGADTTVANSLNTEGAIAGAGCAGSVCQGYLRAPDGRFTTFFAGGSQYTVADDVNPAGTIGGWYFDASNAYHSFLRASDGRITTFEVLGAGTEAGQGTAIVGVDGLNPAGAVAGYYVDASNVFHGFLRAPQGRITRFDAPGAGTGEYEGTLPQGINPAGAIAGWDVDASFVVHGFVRAPDGRIKTFDAPGAGTVTGEYQGTYAQGINPAGAITGYFIDSGNVNHGFVRAPDGTITTFDVPGAGTSAGQGTSPNGINPAGAITGFYIDADGAYHGFLRTMKHREDGEHEGNRQDEF